MKKVIDAYDLVTVEAVLDLMKLYFQIDLKIDKEQGMPTNVHEHRIRQIDEALNILKSAKKLDDSEFEDIEIAI